MCRDGQGSSLEEQILYRVGWLDCSCDTEFAREVDDLHAKFKLGRRVLPIHRLSLEEEIFEAECMLEELWDDTGPSSLCEDRALLVCIARSSSSTGSQCGMYHQARKPRLIPPTPNWRPPCRGQG